MVHTCQCSASMNHTSMSTNNSCDIPAKWVCEGMPRAGTVNKHTCMQTVCARYHFPEENLKVYSRFILKADFYIFMRQSLCVWLAWDGRESICRLIIIVCVCEVPNRLNCVVMWVTERHTDVWYSTSVLSLLSHPVLRKKSQEHWTMPAPQGSSQDSEIKRLAQVEVNIVQVWAEKKTVIPSTASIRLQCSN